MSLAALDLGPLAVNEPEVGDYFVAVYPPFAAWRTEEAAAAARRLATLPSPASPRPFGLYVHVPFCAHRCRYCYYSSHAGKSERQMENYVEALLAEARLYRVLPFLAGRDLGFVYFGGGTPSLLPLEVMTRLCAGLHHLFPWKRVEEVTFECAPCSVTREKLIALHRAGVNRISLGIQQYDDRVLQLNGRTHLVDNVRHAWREIARIRFDEVNVDLMAGLVGETDGSFGRSLEQVLRMEPDSITIYPLEVRRNTPLFRTVTGGALQADLPPWDAKRDRMARAFERLARAGYRPRSAYAVARDGPHRRFVYQEDQYRGADLVGIGASAFSYVAGTHYQNVTNPDAYQATIAERRFPISRAHALCVEEQMIREFVLQLKLGRVNTIYFQNKFFIEVSSRFSEPLDLCRRMGWLVVDDQGVRLTSEGSLRVDRILPLFYLPGHQPFTADAMGV